MKRKLTFLVTVIAAVLVMGCGKSDDKTTTENKTDSKTTNSQQKNESKTLEVSANDKAVEIHTSGMTCTGCENTIKSKVKKVDGVKDVIADFKSNVVKASFDPAKTNPDAIKEAITSAGYKVESVK
ncbi:MAG TPA: cation transporter [Ignavibacteria bacterium]|nr:cation transporter [Ignavibacteria bacterium]HMR00301.1 cation transporter [Ignavibacteria bacterium]